MMPKQIHTDLPINNTNQEMKFDFNDLNEKYNIL